MCENCGTSGLCVVCGWDQGEEVSGWTTDVGEWREPDGTISVAPAVVASPVRHELRPVESSAVELVRSADERVEDFADSLRVDVGYALGQLRTACYGSSSVRQKQDCACRALDALERIAGRLDAPHG